MADHILLRKVRPEDALVWERLRYALWPGEDETHGDVTTAFFQGSLDDPAEVLLASSPDGIAIAFMELSIRTDLPTLPGKRVGYIEGLYFVPEMRFSDVALQLVQAARRWSRSKGCTHFATDRQDRVIVDRGYTP